LPKKAFNKEAKNIFFAAKPSRQFSIGKVFKGWGGKTFFRSIKFINFGKSAQAV